MMHFAVENMLEKYNCRSTDDYKNALKEVIQEIALLGLYRADFFSKAAFYGGSALRIFYGLNRFSEDLDFSLIAPDADFGIDHYCKFIKDELGAYGFNMNVEKKIKNIDYSIESAFIKGGTKINLITISPGLEGLTKLHKNEKIKIKIEIDTNPPKGAGYEVRYQLTPTPFSVRLFDTASLFAGKIHALLYRNWGGNRTKGRDLYDYIWYLSQDTKLNVDHLAQRMKQSGHLESSTLTVADARELLIEKFRLIDYKAAKADVEPFIKNKNDLDLWSKDFFVSVTEERFK
jgi:predicted nucleotidyltransferase component of viral defense system